MRMQIPFMLTLFFLSIYVITRNRSSVIYTRIPYSTTPHIMRYEHTGKSMLEFVSFTPCTNVEYTLTIGDINATILKTLTSVCNNNIVVFYITLPEQTLVLRLV